MSDVLKVGVPAILEWKREKILLPLEIYKKLDPTDNYKKYILEIKEESWGRSKGGLISKGTLKEIKIPEYCEDWAEFIGIVLGDGNVNTYVKGKKIRVYSVKISGDLELDKKYHVNYIKPLCTALFGLKVGISQAPNNEIFTCLYSKELVGLLESMGLKSGDKIINQVTIPSWIKENNNYLRACLRGLIDTDGSIFRMSKRDKNLLRISFTNYNKKLLNDARDAFIKLGYSPSKIISNKQIFISRQNDIRKYINEIGFSNPKHIKRLHSFIAP